MDLPYLIKSYLSGSLFTHLTSCRSMENAQVKITAYYNRLQSIIPATDGVTNMMSTLLDMQDAITRFQKTHSL